jgi:hypothetical protein
MFSFPISWTYCYIPASCACEHDHELTQARKSNLQAQLNLLKILFVPLFVYYNPRLSCRTLLRPDVATGTTLKTILNPYITVTPHNFLTLRLYGHRQS